MLTLYSFSVQRELKVTAKAMKSRHFGILLVATVTVFIGGFLPKLRIDTIQTATSQPALSIVSSQVEMIGLINETDPKMHCCKFVTNTLEELCRADGTIQLREIAKRAEDQQCTCLDFFYCKLVVVTAISTNHYEEAQDMIASVQKYVPNTKLIVYDLGLAAQHTRQLNQYCNTEVRPFVFRKYPPHTKNLQTYAWKPFIIKEITSTYEVVFWADTSVRVTGPLLKVLSFLLKFPFVAGSTLTLPIISLTHDGMLQYLNMPLSRKQMGHFGHIEAGCWVMWANSVMRTKFLSYWVDCALHPECIAPPGTKLVPCNFKLANAKKGTGMYIGCNRYDQSALAMILIREFGLQVWNMTVHDEVKTLVHVQRAVTHQFIKVC